MKRLILLCVIILYFTSCTVVKGYEKVDLNDPDMVLNELKIKKFETNFHVYREGASGANGGKTGGGCGCN